MYPLDGKQIYKGASEGDICFSKQYLDDVVAIKIKEKKKQ